MDYRFVLYFCAYLDAMRTYSNRVRFALKAGSVAGRRGYHGTLSDGRRITKGELERPFKGLFSTCPNRDGERLSKFHTEVTDQTVQDFVQGATTSESTIKRAKRVRVSMGLYGCLAL